MTRCRKLPKALKDWQAFRDLKKTIDDFNESCPLLELMANKAMKLRHWTKIGDLTSHQFDVESDTFLLRNIMEAPLLKYKEDIEVCCIKARLDLLRGSIIHFISYCIDAMIAVCYEHGFASTDALHIVIYLVRN